VLLGLLFAIQVRQETSDGLVRLFVVRNELHRLLEQGQRARRLSLCQLAKPKCEDRDRILRAQLDRASAQAGGALAIRLNQQFGQPYIARRVVGVEFQHPLVRPNRILAIPRAFMG